MNSLAAEAVGIFLYPAVVLQGAEVRHAQALDGTVELELAPFQIRTFKIR